MSSPVVLIACGAEFFRLPAGVQVPDFVLTTATADAGFTSVGLQVAPDRKLGKPGVYKVFSHHVGLNLVRRLHGHFLVLTAGWCRF